MRCDENEKAGLRALVDGSEVGTDGRPGMKPVEVAAGQSNVSGYGGSFTELYNTTEQAYLIDGHETWGADVVWLHAPFSLPNGYTPPQTLLQSVMPPGPVRVAQ